MSRRHRVVSFHHHNVDGGIHAREDGWFDRRAPRQKHAWSAIKAEPIPDDEPIPEMWLDEFDGNEPAYEAWVDEDDDNWALPSMSPLAQFGEGARHYCRPYVDKHPGRKAVRKSWTRRHPRKLPFHGVTEADLAVEATSLGGSHESVEHRRAA